MPFCLGLHPGFNVPLDDEEDFGDYVLTFEREETCDSPVLDPETGLVRTAARRPVLENTRQLPLCHELFAADALVLENLRSRKVCLYSKHSGRGVEMNFDGFDFFGGSRRTRPLFVSSPGPARPPATTRTTCSPISGA